MLTNITTFQLHGEGLENGDFLFSAAGSQDESLGSRLHTDLKPNPDGKLTKKHICGALHDHFRKIAAVRQDADSSIEVWVEDEGRGTRLTRTFDRFSLIPECRSISEGRELTVSFNGSSPVFRFPVSSIDLRGADCDLMTGGEILRYSELTREQKQRLPSAYPVLDAKLAARLGVPIEKDESPKDYSSVHAKTADFYDRFLRGKTIGNLILFSSDGLLSVPEDRVLHLPQDSDALLFAGGRTGVNPESEIFSGERGSGPFLPSKHRDVRFFFIFRSTDARVCRQLEYVLGFGAERQAGPKAYPSLGETIRQPFDTAGELNVEFDLDLNRRPQIGENAEKALAQIEERLEERNFSPNVRYVAIFINPVESADPEHPVNGLYFKLAESLLHRNIIPQSVSRADIVGGHFGGPLADLHTRILAKIDGVPWSLPERETGGGIIFGVGRFSREGRRKRTLAPVCRFSESGHFLGGDCIPGCGGGQIASHVRQAVRHSGKRKRKVSRVILHFDGTLSEDERKAIPNALLSLDSGIAFFLVEISRTETRGRAVFDPASKTLLPQSGTYIRLTPDSFLLFTNSGDGENPASRTNFPIGIRISKHAPDHGGERSALSEEEARSIISGIHGLSLICWHSLTRQNLPATLLYPELMATALRHFRTPELPPFGTKTLWFL